jgi:hypothetical protein
MGIAPIPGIQPLGPVRPPETNLRQPPIFEIDGVEKPSDGQGQGNKRKAAGAEEDEEDEQLLEAGEEEQPSDTFGGVPDESPARQVDYFA